LLKNYIHAPTPTNLDQLVETMHPAELPVWIQTLLDNQIFTDQQLSESITTIENEFIARQWITDVLWTIAAVCSLSMAYWVRKFFFPESFGYFIKQSFSAEEVETMRKNMHTFWSGSIRQVKVDNYNHRTKDEYLNQIENSTAFHQKLFPTEKKGLFNQYGELRKRLVENPKTKAIEVTGTQQQIDSHIINLSNKLMF
jgi:hypothetical protein